jgi:uncharacterized protein (TIGR02246 family)
MATRDIRPVVTVPVLSSTTVSTRRVDSSTSGPRMRMPSWAPRPVPTSSAVGAARPSAHGQAMISTATAALNAAPTAPSPPSQNPSVATARAMTMGTNTAATRLSLYEDDAVFVPEPGAQPLAGREAIREALTRFAALHPSMTADIRQVVVAGDIATVLNTWQMHGTDPDGAPVHMGATSADVMRRRADGSWGILIDDPWGA